MAWTKTLPGDPKLESSMLHGPQYGEKKIAWQMPKRWKRAEAKRQRSESAESPKTSLSEMSTPMLVEEILRICREE